MFRIETERLILRPWEDRDLAPLRAMSADSRVMDFFPGPLSEEECCEQIAVARAQLEQDGFAFLPVEDKANGDFAGWVGLNRLSFESYFTPAVEIGWCLAVESWGRGFASEAAYAWLNYGFDQVGLDEIIAIAVRANRRSVAVMERIGMRRDANEDFQHPNVDPNSSRSWHVLYRLKCDDYFGR